MTRQRVLASRLSAIAMICGALVACGGSPKVEHDYPTKSRVDENTGSLFSGKAFSVFSGDEKGAAPAEIGVNADLWRAALDTFSFMPLVSADPMGGVIITDWYTDPSNLNERSKATIYILAKELRADALRVSVFREQRSENGWVSVPTAVATQRQLEDVILVRAREFRIAGQASRKD